MNHEITTRATVTTDQALAVLETWESQAGYWELDFRNHIYEKYEGDYTRLVSVECKCTDQPGVGVPVEDDWWLIDQHTVINGIQIILEGGITNGEDEIRQMLAEGDIDGADIDQADVIVQAGLFGWLVYG